MNILKYCPTSLLAIAMTLLVTHQTQAQVNRISTGEQSFAVEYNQHGAVLTPMADPIYLDGNCEAYAPHIGTGAWGQAIGGLRVELIRDSAAANMLGATVVIGFPRQNIDISGCPLPSEQ